MATTTFDNAFVGTEPRKAADKKPGLFATLLAAREREARRKVGHYLATLSESQLEQLGFTQTEVDKLRQGDALPAAE